MEDEVKDGGAAFPSSFRYELEDWSEPGMSLRDWFAGQIIAGALANPGLLERVAGRTLEQMMREVYEGADALLSARGEPK